MSRHGMSSHQARLQQSPESSVAHTLLEPSIERWCILQTAHFPPLKGSVVSNAYPVTQPDGTGSKCVGEALPQEWRQAAPCPGILGEPASQIHLEDGGHQALVRWLPWG